MPGQKTLNQERARFAFNEVKGIKELYKEKKDKIEKYASNAKKLPALITTNGLIPTLAFLKSKEETMPVYKTMNEWLIKKGFANNNDALGYLLTCDFSTLRLATMEAVTFANWLKRMVEIEMKQEGETNG
jgi:CRISPR-associated protein Cmr5